MENSIKVFNLGGLPTAPLDFALMDLRFQRFLTRKFKHLIRRKLSKKLQLIIQSSLKRIQTRSYSLSIISVAMTLLSLILATT